MEPHPFRTSMRFLLFLAGLCLQTANASGQQPESIPPSAITPEVSDRLIESARDAALAPWQRDFMLQVAGGGAETTADDGKWRTIAPPSRRTEHAAIYDPVRDRMLLFGGADASFPYRDEVWALSLSGTPAWSLIEVAGTRPPGREMHSAFYDPVRDRMVVFGGYGNDYLNDVWALSLAGSPAWTLIVPSGTPPLARRRHAAIYDPIRDRMVMYGGENLFSFGTFSDIWALSLSGTPAWSFISATGGPPVPRYGHTTIYDPVRDRMVMFGGYNPNVGKRNDVWALSLGVSPAWTALAPAGTPPVPREAHAAFYDPVRDRMVVYAGLDDSGYRNDTWALSLAGSPAWSLVTTSGTIPTARRGHVAIHDPVRDRLVAFGGTTAGGRLNDVRGLTLSGSPAWSDLTPAGDVPPTRSSNTAIYDPLRRRMVVFGGTVARVSSNDVWALSLTGTPAWSPISTAGTPPPDRINSAAIYDPIRDRMVIFGGYSTSAGGYVNDSWGLTLAGSPTWVELTPTGTLPAARSYHTAIYEPVADRMVVFGGFGSGTPFDDAWALPLAGGAPWYEIPVGTRPSARTGHSAIYDATRQRMVVFGGWDSIRRNDVWELSFLGTPAWSELSPAGTLPPVHAYHTAVHDLVRDRMVVFGGSIVPGRTNRTWALSLSGGGAWSELAPAGSLPAELYLVSGIYDSEGDRLVVFGGYNDAEDRNEVWMLEWATAPIAVPGGAVAFRGGIELSPPRPNPSSGESRIEFELSQPARVVLDVFDSQGRRVRRVADAWFSSGRHTRAWQGDDDRGRTVGTGVYFLRMQSGGLQQARRIVRLD